MGCHGNHALSHGPHKLFLRTMFSHLWSPIEQFGTMNNFAPMRRKTLPKSKENNRTAAKLSITLVKWQSICEAGSVLKEERKNNLIHFIS